MYCKLYNMEQLSNNFEQKAENEGIGESRKRKLNESDTSSECKKSNVDLSSNKPAESSTCKENPSFKEKESSQNHRTEDSTIDVQSTQSENRIEDLESRLLSLSDDILLILLSYLNSTDLYYLSCCNRRLFNICGDRTLWNTVTSTCDGAKPRHQSLTMFFHQTTNYLRCVNNGSNEGKVNTCFDNGFFKEIHHYAPHLKTLIIENHTFYGKTFTLKFLPSSITELRLIKVKLIDTVDGRHFCDIGYTLPQLEILDVSFCQWFSTHSLLALAKCFDLKELRITGCRNLRDFIPYASLAATFGFKKLQTLDMRLTDLVDREISCFNKTKTLKHIYLERPEDFNEINDESVTDVCTTSFGMGPCANEHSRIMVFITRVPMEGHSFMNHTLETLVIRNYPRITDITLKHAQHCLKSLKYLDVTGCGCTAAQASIFKMNRPEVKLIFDGAPL